MSSSDPTPTGAAELDLRDITVRFGGLTALDGVGLAVAPRRVHGVIGPNGAGKTTLFNVACGFVQPDSGSIRIRGEARARLRPQRPGRARHRPHPAGPGPLRPPHRADNVVVGADRHARSGFLRALLATPGSSRDERRLRERAHDVLDRARAWPSTPAATPPSLPYPVRKRVALARALVAEPDLLLLDEPASGLSSDEIDELGELSAA